MDFFNDGNIAEILGTFLFVTGIFAADGDFMQICAALAVAGAVTGATMNPAFTAVAHFNGGSNNHMECLATVFCQVIGACIAWKVHEWLSGGKAKSGSGSATFNEKEFVAEALGTFIFASGVNAAADNNYGASVALFTAMHAVGDVSSELNPGLTILRLIQNNGDGNQGALTRIVAQCAGAWAAGFAKQYYA